MRRTTTLLRVLLLGAVLALGAGCAAKAPTKVTDFTAPVQHPPMKAELSPDSPFYVYDPWERMNRRVYDFNARLDDYVLMPVVNAYETVTPKPVQKGVSNFFSNIGEVPTFINCVLQLDVEGAANTLGRFVTNTTIGLGGLVDMASRGGLYDEDEDFGQTLGVWGVPTGPYVVLPVFGPSNVRDTAGVAVDSTIIWMEESAVMDKLDPDHALPARIAYGTLKGIDVRKQILFHYYENGALFEYDLVRFLYMKKREWDVKK
ncbi:VacJ family lipoprotein [Desulfobaculum senezii]